MVREALSGPIGSPKINNMTAATNGAVSAADCEFEEDFLSEEPDSIEQHTAKLT